MGVDETATMAALRTHRAELIDPAIAEHDGRLVKTMGDGLLLEFPSVVGAVNWAVAVQKAMAGRNKDAVVEQRIEFRIGINLGDIAIDGDDIFGDGVNVAARVQETSASGGVAISGIAHESLGSLVDIAFEEGGEQHFKNIARPIRVWRWAPNRPAAMAMSVDEPLPLPNKPSIAVLPFDNLSSDPEQAYFADGIVEDLITALARFPWLFVIARNSSFSYKGKTVPVKQVSEELGVRYVVEGSVRRSETRLRVTAQLIDAVNDRHVWADSYDRPVGDLFDLQDEITRTITGVLVPALSSAERARFSRENRPSLDAWEAYQKGLAYYYQPYSDEGHRQARQLFDSAIELDPDIADSHVMIALMGVYAINSGQSSYSGSREEILAEALRAAERAVQLEDNNALAHTALGRLKGSMGDAEAGIAECETAVALNPNIAVAHYELGFVLFYAGRYAEAISCFEKAIELSPNDPSRWNFLLLKGDALSFEGEYEEAIVNLSAAARLRPTAFWPYVNLAASHAALGRMEEARAAMKETLARNPDCTSSFVVAACEGLPNDDLQAYIARLQKAGLPD
jgi:adenylate cyclase